MAFPVVTSRQVRGGAAATAAAIAIATPFIIKWEGVDYVARHFSFDPPGVVTVCNGLTNIADIPELKVGDRYTPAQCAELLRKVLPKYAAPIDKCVKVPITDTMRAALYSASYNLGPGTVCKSSMVRKINAGQDQSGCDAFLLYTMANGKFLQGLMNRRKDERKLCLS